MSTDDVNKVWSQFFEVAAPYLHIVDQAHYEEALALIEELLEEGEDSHDDPRNVLIEILSKSIAEYEKKDEALNKFDEKAHQDPADVAMLRLLIDQHQLKLSDLPEIEDKTLLSKILKGERKPTKQHIITLSERFGISPALFF
ncbi:helix-turn-helix domain-containing protein [Zooshikella harenae]|uniref:Transcriptional regulator n=1 Tax=Zooshikella harenae TaxID=2827238 RepID=A0ABS5ZKE3_9GAMM|nr:transcriptional regulator [Zooshikella harenae]MBU2714419.1 transcriptional regulator [Zooshikella harenae]